MVKGPSLKDTQQPLRLGLPPPPHQTQDYLHPQGTPCDMVQAQPYSTSENAEARETKPDHGSPRPWEMTRESKVAGPIG